MDAAPDASDPQPEDKPSLAGAETLISELRDRVAFLQRELERKDAILLNMTEAMKAIAPPAHEEAAQEPPVVAEGATEQPGRVEPQAQVEGAQSEASAERVSWWKRMFGG